MGKISTRLGGKVTTIKGEFKQQDSKLCLCIYCLFYIIVITKKVKYFEVMVLLDMGTYLTGVSDRCYYKKWKILLNSNGKNMIPVKERALVFQEEDL